LPRNLAAGGGEHELDELLGDFGFQAFGMALAEANDVGDDAAVSAIWVLKDFGGAGLRQVSAGISPINTGRCQLL